jgi:hypothetical protein
MFSVQKLQAIASKLSFSKLGMIVSLGLATLTISDTLATSAKASESPMADGTYLYGQTAEPEQIGQEYLVFQINQGKVVGAVYLPQSEFSCFSGTVDAAQMSLSIIDPYDKTVYPYNIALENRSPIASQGGLPRDLGLEGYQQISEIGENDRRILNTCRQQLR